jgi:hypothetical protein
MKIPLLYKAKNKRKAATAALGSASRSGADSEGSEYQQALPEGLERGRKGGREGGREDAISPQALFITPTPSTDVCVCVCVCVCVLCLPVLVRTCTVCVRVWLY